MARSELTRKFIAMLNLFDSSTLHQFGSLSTFTCTTQIKNALTTFVDMFLNKIIYEIISKTNIIDV